MTSWKQNCVILPITYTNRSATFRTQVIIELFTFNTLYPYESRGNVSLSGFCGGGGGTVLAVSLAVDIKNKPIISKSGKEKRVWKERKSIKKKKVLHKGLTRWLDLRLILTFLGRYLLLLLCCGCLQLFLCNLKIFLRAVCILRIWRSICIIRDINGQS